LWGFFISKDPLMRVNMKNITLKPTNPNENGSYGNDAHLNR